MSLALKLSDLATRIATEAKSLRTLINGNAADLNALTTSDKTNIVNAMNEIAAAAVGAANLTVSRTATTFTVASDTGTDAVVPTASGTLAGAMVSADFTKLAAIASGATVNDTDANLLARANHTGTQAIATISGLQAALDAKIESSLIGVNNGVASLDGAGKIPTSQLPTASAGGITYQGTWNASTNSPTLANGTGTAGDQYTVNVAGSTSVDGINDWEVGDWIVFNGTVWEKIDNTDAVTSVNGSTGAISGLTTDAAVGDTEQDLVTVFNTGLV